MIAEATRLIEKNRRLLYILRRAVWIGSASALDVAHQFGVSRATSRRDLDDALAHWPEVLFAARGEVRRRITPGESTPLPHEVSAEAMLSAIEMGTDQKDLGLGPRDLSCITRPLAPYRPHGQLGEIILSAAIRRSQIEILYIGMRHGEKARWRHVTAIGIELVNHAWRLIAMDNKKKLPPGHPGRQQSFVMARIFDARIPARRIRIDDPPAQVNTRHQTYDVRLNAGLTEEQAEAVRREFGVRNNQLRLPARDVYETRITFAGGHPGPDIVWPPFEQIGDD